MTHSSINPLRRAVRIAIRCVLATSVLLLGACVAGRTLPGTEWLLHTAAGGPSRPPAFHRSPVRVSETLKFTAIAAGADHTCAISVDGDTYCWGSNQYRQLGDAVSDETCANGSLACSSTPVLLENAPRFTALAASLWSTCGLDASGRAHCWGFGLAGRRGEPLPASSGVPVTVPGGHAFVALTASAAGNRTCGLDSAGDAWCWGLANDAARGDGTSPAIFAGPDPVANGTKLVSVSVGAQHACGIDAARNAVCWGSNQFGQLGVGSSALDGGLRESATPVAVRGGLAVNEIVAGPGHTCALQTGGAPYCWGLSFPHDAKSAAVSRPDRRTIQHGSVPVPLETAATRWARLGAGTSQTCALTVDGELYCFRTTPAPGVARRVERVESDQPFVEFAVGGNHACALGADGFAYCWGSSHAGQAGPATTRG
jgi:alpha-tubulin suppressor-like RCC1 family protein